MQGRDVTLVSAARRRLALVLASTALGIAAAAGTVLVTDSSYTSSTQLYVAVAPSAAQGRDVFSSLSYIESRAESYASLVANDSFRQRVADIVGAGSDPRITAGVEQDTSLLTISASDDTAELARSAADAAAVLLGEIALPLDAVPLDGAAVGDPAQPPLQFIVSEPADLPDAPTSPVVALNLIVGLVVGAGIGLGVAALAARADDRVGEPDDVGDLAADVGPVFWMPTKRWGGASSGPRREDYELRLAALHHELTTLPGSQGRVLVLSAPIPESARASSQVAQDLTVTLSQGGRSAILAVMHSRATSDPRPGLSDAIAGTHVLADVIDRSGSTGMYAVGAGTQPLRLLTASESEIRALLAELAGVADVIVVDAADLSAPAGTAVVARVADAVLIVAGRGDVRGEELLDARATVKRWRANYLGVLLAPQVRRSPLDSSRRSSAPASIPARTAQVGESSKG